MAAIRKRKDAWQVQVRRRGCSPVSKTFRRKSDALEWARYMEVKADRQDLPVDTRILSTITFGQLLVRYQSEIVPRKRSQESEFYHIKKILTYGLSKEKLSDLSLHHFSQFREERLKDVKASTFVREHTIIRHCLRISRDEWGVPIKKDLLDGFKKPVVRDTRTRRLSMDEYIQIKSYLDSKNNQSYSNIVTLAIETGMRRGELLNIKRRDIDLERALLFIPQTKNGHPRTIWSTPILWSSFKFVVMRVFAV